jgi:GNAT superfamily N-acetyltransferase
MSTKYTLSHIDILHDVDDIVSIHRADIGGHRPKLDTPDQWYKLGGPWMEPNLAKSYFSDIIANGGGIYVIRENGKVISEVEIEPISKDMVFLSLLIVHPDHRRKGVGREIIRLLNIELYRQGIRRIATCPEEEAKEFYAKLGYHPWKQRALIEGNNGLSTSHLLPHSWSASSLPSNEAPMILGHNQPPQHHMIRFSMKYFEILNIGGRNILFFETQYDAANKVIVGLYETGSAPDDKVWLFAWGQIPIETAFFLAVECARIHSSRDWFTYCSPEEAQALRICPDAEEAWWIGAPVNVRT